MQPPSRKRRREGTVVRSHYTKRPRQDEEAPPQKGADVSNRMRGEASPRLGEYPRTHWRVMLSALAQLRSTPFSTSTTAAVIGIALALPAGLYLFLMNVQQITAHWDASAQVTLFLKQDTPENQARALARKLGERDDISDVEYISQDRALQEFQQYSGFGDALHLLEENPLPTVLVVTPHQDSRAPGAIESLLQTMERFAEVESVKLDMQWLHRLNGLIAVAQRAAHSIAALLAVAIIVIVGNTMRMIVQNRRREIEVTKLIGATDAFIRRPFLYCGFWYGLLGALVAWVLVFLVLSGLHGPVAQLATLYNSDFRLDGLGLTETLVLLGAGVGLGWLGAWLFVGRHLRAIDVT